MTFFLRQCGRMDVNVFDSRNINPQRPLTLQDEFVIEYVCDTVYVFYVVKHVTDLKMR